MQRMHVSLRNACSSKTVCSGCCLGHFESSDSGGYLANSFDHFLCIAGADAEGAAQTPLRNTRSYIQGGAGEK